MPDNKKTHKRYTGNKIKWIINECCNFQCSYCGIWHNDHKQISKTVDMGKLAEAMDYLGKDWYFCIAGGEPFLEKNFVDICREITKKHYIGLITNLSTPNVYEFADTIDPKKCTSVITSVHITEREKKDNGLKQYIDKMLYMQKRGFNISADYVAYPLLCQRMVNDFEYLRSNGIQKINFKLFFGRFDGKDYPDAYTQDIRELIQKNDSDCFENEILAQKSTGFYRKLCHAGNRFFLMNRKGDMRRCSSGLMSYGNMFEKTIKFDVNIKPCPIHNYSCLHECIENSLDTKGKIYSVLKEDFIEKFLVMKNRIPFIK